RFDRVALTLVTEDVVVNVRTPAGRTTLLEVQVVCREERVPSDIVIVPGNATVPVASIETTVNVNISAHRPAEYQIVIGEVARRLRAIGRDGVIPDKVGDITLHERESAVSRHHAVGVEVVEEISHHPQLRLTRVGKGWVRAIGLIVIVWVRLVRIGPRVGARDVDTASLPVPEIKVVDEHPR